MRALLFAFLTLGCSTSIAGRDFDGGGDTNPRDTAPPDGTRDVMRDVSLEDRAFTDISDVRDVGVASDGALADTGPDGPRVEEGCEHDPPSGPPAGTNRSCASGGAPAWHCNEVHYCGGTFLMGSTNAMEILVQLAMGGPGKTPFYRMRHCDVHRARAHTGYVDAYEVTVARFRAWVRAGMPHPAIGERYFRDLVWRNDFRVEVPTRASSMDLVTGFMANNAMCTYSDTPGVNDDLPVNCVQGVTATAFCWWDGKHVATEVSWEYLARNRGRTTMPFGEAPEGNEACRRGDVGAFTGLCPREDIPQPVNAFPLGATMDPPGIFGLYGGVLEGTIGPRRPYSGGTTSCIQASESVDGEAVEYVYRGTSWFQSLEDHRAHENAASRGSSLRPDGVTVGTRSPQVGIRCMRWVPEPRGS
jgi:formylglycine-generating enzyme required for sulfatase activity